MTNRMYKILVRGSFFAALLAAMLLVASPARAQVDTEASGTKTALVISLSGYNELIGDISFLGELMDKPGVSQMVEGGLAAFTGGRGLAGIDKSKPWGVAVQADGPEFKPLVFLPVESLDQVLTTLAPLAGGKKPEQGEDGVYEIAAGPQTVYLKEANGWAFIAQTAAGLEDLPADPVKLLGGLEKQYDLAIRAYIQNIDESYRNLAVEQIRVGVESGLDQLPDEDDEQYQMRRQMTLSSIEQIETFFNEADELTVGWKIDADEKTTHLDMLVTAVDGTTLAKQVAQIKDAKSDFAGFLLPGSAAKLNLSGKTGTPEDIARTVTMIDTLRKRAMISIDEDSNLDDQSRDKVKSALDGLFDVAETTIKEGSVDVGATVRLAPETLTIVAGGLVSSGADVEAALKKLASAAKKDANFPGVNWDADKHGAIRLHTMEVTVPDEDAQELFGEKLDVVLGVGEKSFYVSIGRDALATLKTIIDKSKSAAGEKVPPMQMAISLGKILKFASEKDDDPQLALIAEALVEAGDRDHVNVRLTAVDRGVRYRVEVEDGVLKAFGKAIAAQSAAGF